MTELLQKNEHMEFYLGKRYVWYNKMSLYTNSGFIEGGRSRTGKVLPAKCGLLSMVVNAVASGITKIIR